MIKLDELKKYLLIAASVLLLAAHAHAANDYFPEEVGVNWTYALRGGDAKEEIRTIPSMGIIADSFGNLDYYEWSGNAVYVNGDYDVEDDWPHYNAHTPSILLVPPSDVPGVYQNQVLNERRYGKGYPNPGSMSIHTTVEVIGLQDVVVPAGSFPKCMYVFKVYLDVNGPWPGYYEEIQEWYAKGVGLVKRIKRDFEANGTPDGVELMELTSFSKLSRDVFPVIRANGSNQPVYVNSNEKVTITIELPDSTQAGMPANYWIFCKSPQGIISNVRLRDWRFGYMLCQQAPILPISPAVTLLDRQLPSGDYVFLFSLNRDLGMAKHDRHCLSRVEVIVR